MKKEEEQQQLHEEAKGWRERERVRIRIMDESFPSVSVFSCWTSCCLFRDERREKRKHEKRDEVKTVVRTCRKEEELAGKEWMKKRERQRGWFLLVFHNVFKWIFSFRFALLIRILNLTRDLREVHGYGNEDEVVSHFVLFLSFSRWMCGMKKNKGWREMQSEKRERKRDSFRQGQESPKTKRKSSNSFGFEDGIQESLHVIDFPVQAKKFDRRRLRSLLINDVYFIFLSIISSITRENRWKREKRSATFLYFSLKFLLW